MIYKEIYITDLYSELWSGGLDTYEYLLEHGITDSEIEEMINGYFPDGVELTNLNDFFWFEYDEIFAYFGIEEETEGE